MKRYTYVLIALLSGSMIVSCGQSSRDKIHENVVAEERTEDDALLGLEPTEQTAEEIEVVAENMQYNPNQIRVQAGQEVRIRLINRGNEEHNIEFELPAGDEKLEQNLQPGERGTLSFTAPQEPGTYTIYCPVNDHREKGMTGQLIVE